MFNSRETQAVEPPKVDPVTFPCWCNNSPNPCSGNDINCLPGIVGGCIAFDCSGGGGSHQ